MPRSDRLLRLLHAMRTSKTPVTAARLAVETGVSIRSLYRDIDALRAAGARIDGERGFGYRLLEDPALPPQTFDQDEIETLAVALAEVRGWGEPTFARAADSILAKVAAILPGDRERQLVHAISHVFRPEPRYASTIDLATVRDACRREQALSICYRDREGSSTTRTIFPLALVFNEECVTILAWCCLREEFRMFRTDRLTAAAFGSHSFRPHRITLLREYVGRLQEQRARRMNEVADGPA